MQLCQRAPARLWNLSQLLHSQAQTTDALLSQLAHLLRSIQCAGQVLHHIREVFQLSVHIVQNRLQLIQRTRDPGRQVIDLADTLIRPRCHGVTQIPHGILCQAGLVGDRLHLGGEIIRNDSHIIQQCVTHVLERTQLIPKPLKKALVE